MRILANQGWSMPRAVLKALNIKEKINIFLWGFR
jgi:hypothetical protein